MEHLIAKRYNVNILGEGEQTMMLAHGFGCDQNMWRFIVPAFVNDYRIILFDYMGCSKSDLAAYHPERYRTLDGYAQDISDICTALNLKDIIFVGHSVSAMIGVLAQIKLPGLFRSMVMIGPSPCYINDAGYHGGFEKADLLGLLAVMDNNFAGWAGFLAPVVMKNEDRPELTKELEASFCSADPMITRRFAEATFLSDTRNHLFKVQVPVLVMQCAEDTIAPETAGDFTAQQLPQSKIVKMKATGHCPHMSHPNETIEVIQNYLEELYETV